ncbi:MAG: hypothetical protein BIFFINMI_01209 [Phycisphaerae bacterium]|nr:hypothetical protein [Phycisphaerae bacterium]
MSDVRFESPYPQSGPVHHLKGNLHTHSTRSDGRLDIQEVIRAYAECGYGLLMMSDHDTQADLAGLDPCGMVLLPGNEISAGGPHMLHIGAASLVGGRDRQAAISRINAEGGLAVLCHPNWEAHFNHCPIETLRALTGYAGIEIFNGGTHWGLGGGLALYKWDMLLTGGRRVWGFANDDAHKPEDIGRGWNVVMTADRSVAGVMDALRRGAFYASTGVTIESIRVDGSTVHVKTADATGIAVISESGKRLGYVDSTEMFLDGGELGVSYVRFECYGRGDRLAWTQPLFLSSAELDRLRGLLEEVPVLNAVRVDPAPKLTGTMSDPQWRQAKPAGGFYARPGATPPPVTTEVRGLLAGGTLYLAFRCDEPMPEGIKTAVTEDGRTSIWADDAVEVFLGLDESRPQDYWHVMVNAAGRSVGVHMPDGTVGLEGLRAAAGRSLGGWSVEVAIPVQALGARCEPGSAWRFNVCRNRCPQPGSYVFSWVGPTNHAPDRFGVLRV